MLNLNGTLICDLKKKKFHSLHRCGGLFLCAAALLFCVFFFAPAGGLAEPVSLYGREFDSQATALDLTDLSITSASRLPTLLEAFPNLKTVNLGEQKISVALRRELRERFAQVDFQWSFLFFGQPMTQDTESLDMGSRALGEEGKEQLPDLMAALPKLRSVKVFETLFTPEEFETYRERFPQIKFECKLKIAGRGVRTDATAFSTRKTNQKPFYKEADVAGLQYVPNLLGLDLGHNALSDLSFLSSFPNLRVLILADNDIADLSWLAPMKDMEYLELFMNQITDLTPLAGMTQLVDLNLCYNDVTDLTPLYSLPHLRRLWISNNPNLSKGEIYRFRERMPQCEVNITAKMSTQEGWRDSPHYDVIHQSFLTYEFQEFDDLSQGEETKP